MTWSVLLWGIFPFFLFDLAWKLWKWFSWKPRPALAGHAAVVRRRERHPLLRWPTWLEIVGIVFFGLVPLLLDARTQALEPKPVYDDARQSLIEVRRECPALARQANDLIARGVPSAEQVGDIVARQEMIARNPVRGQVCSPPPQLHPFAEMVMGRASAGS